MSIATLDQAHLRLATGRLYFLPTGETGWIDLGNCQSMKPEHEVRRVDHFRKAEGLAEVDVALVAGVKRKRTFVFDEHFVETLRLQRLADPALITEPPLLAGSGDTTVIDAGDLVLGRSYMLEGRPVSALSGENGAAVTLVADVDYKLDAGAGVLTILSEAKFGSDWTFEYDYAAVEMINFIYLGRLLEQGSFRYVEKDQRDTVPVVHETFTGQVQVTGWGESAEKYQEYTVEVLQTS